MPDLKLDGTALTDAIDYMRDLSGANVHVNWKALEEAGVSKDVPVTCRLRGVPFRTVLTLVLNEAGPGLLSYYVDDNVIEITTRELADTKMTTRLYPVEDLLMEIPDFVAPSMNLTDSNGQGGGSGGGGGNNNGGGGGGQGLFGGGNGGNTKDEEKGKTRAERAQELIELIEALLMPDVWIDNGGKASIKFFNGSLIVTAPNSVHEALGGPVD